MKLPGILLLCFLTFTACSAQEQTLIAGNFESGGFGGPVVKIGSFNGQTGVLVGGRGGWIINHTFILGGGAYSLVSDINASTPGPGQEPYLNFGYAGLELEYTPHWDRLVHLSVGLLVGAGGVGTRQANGSNSGDSRSFFTMEPWVNANLNVTHFFRISAGMTYRWVTGAHSGAASDGGLSGLSGMLLLRFGSF